MAWLPWAFSTFSTDSLEQEYQTELGAEKIRLTRIVAVLGTLLTLVFMSLDVWAIPSAITAVWVMRGSIVAGLAITFWTTTLPRFQTIYAYVVVAAFSIMGGGVSAMIYMAEPTDVAIDAYYGGLLLIIVGAYTLTYLSPWLCTAMSVVLTTGYAVIQIFAHGYGQGQQVTVLAAHLFIFYSMTILGIVAKAVRDSYSRENYLLRHSLQHDVRIKEEEKRHASYLAEHDPLTGLANRLRFDKDVSAMLERARTSGGIVQILFVDLDGFKPVNDAYGHSVGDRALRVMAERLRRAAHPNHVVARVGGDEFVVAILTSPSHRNAGALLAEQIAAAIIEPIELRGSTLRLTASIGIAGYPMDGNDVADVLRAADAQMYVVKNRGKAGISMTPDCRGERLVG